MERREEKALEEARLQVLRRNDTEVFLMRVFSVVIDKLPNFVFRL
jgi:hypothetical protein